MAYNNKHEQITITLSKAEVRKVMKCIAVHDLHEGETDMSNRIFNKISDAYSKAMGWKEG